MSPSPDVLACVEELAPMNTIELSGFSVGKDVVVSCLYMNFPNLVFRNTRHAMNIISGIPIADR